MTENEEFDGEEQLSFGGVGQKLRDARERLGMDLAQVAAATRIPQRHLVHIEKGEFAALPARTYAVGFSRSYARLVGLDEKRIADEVREELSASINGADGRMHKMEPGDPARVPDRGLAWAAALAAILLAAGGFAFFRSYLAPGSGPPSLLDQERAAQAQAELNKPAAPAPGPAVAAPSSTGQVVFTALEEGVWAKFYDGEGRQLFQKQMTKGESFAIPADANGPQVWTGRPDALRITIGGVEVPRLADEERVMRDVKVDAASLLARTAIMTPPATQAATAVDNPAT